MRFLMTGLVAILVLFGAAQAGAYAVTMTSNYTEGTPLELNDTIIVDIFLDADPGLQIFGMGVVYDNTELAYDRTGSEMLPPQGPGSSGAQPSYILYTAGKPATTVYPLQQPSFAPWPNPPPGKGQVNVNYAEAALNPADASGTNIYIATLLFDVVSLGDGAASIEMTFEAGGNVLRSNQIELDPADIPLTGTPILVTVPEPASAGLAFAALAVTGFLVRRRRRA